jgi:hypothetical protein
MALYIDSRSIRQVKAKQTEGEQMLRVYIKNLYAYVKVAVDYVGKVQDLDDTV